MSIWNSNKTLTEYTAHWYEEATSYASRGVRSGNCDSRLRGTLGYTFSGACLTSFADSMVEFPASTLKAALVRRLGVPIP
jgi:hypothetical protein